jgi:hypothetical protein
VARLPARGAQGSRPLRLRWHERERHRSGWAPCWCRRHADQPGAWQATRKGCACHLSGCASNDPPRRLLPRRIARSVMVEAITLDVPAYTRDCGFCCSGPRRRFARVGMPRWHMISPTRQRIPLPVGNERDMQPREGAEQDRDQVTPTADAWPVEPRRAEHRLISGGCCLLDGAPCAVAPGGHQAGARLSRSLRTSPRSCANADTPFDGRLKPCDRAGQVAGGSGDVRPGGDV